MSTSQVGSAAAEDNAMVEMNGEATFTGPEGTAGTENATGHAQVTKDAGNRAPGCLRQKSCR